MKRAILVVAAVSGYCLLDAGLLLSTVALPRGYSFPSPYQTAVDWGQIVLIPGLAAMLSWAMHGSHQWSRRTLTILLVGSLSGPILFALIVLPFALPFLVPRIDELLFASMLVLYGCGLLLGLRTLIRRAENWAVKREAERYLAERNSGISFRERQWRTRGIHVASCIPVITVLLVYLFLFQIWGLLSHVAQPRAGDLPGYRVPIPATWIILDRWEGENGESALWGMASQRTCVDPYAPSYLPTVCLSGWDIRSEHFGQASETPIFRRHPTEIPGRWYDEGVIDRREFRVGGETVACQKFRPPSHVDNSSLTYIECSGTGRLRAHIRGPGGPIPAFFEMLSGVSLKQK